MKIYKYSILFSILALSLASCSYDTSDFPKVINEEEVITTMEVELAPQGGGDTVMWVSRDLDGDGPNAPVVTVSGPIRAASSYSGSIEWLNETTPDDISLCVLPLYHINAEMVSISSALVSNSCVVIVSKFSVSNFWQILEKYQCTWFSVVPTIISYLLNDNFDVSKLNLSSIRFGRSASAPLSPEVHKKFEKVFKLNIVETMGLTETAAQILSNPLNNYKHGSAGIAYGNEVRVVNDQNNFVKPGESGELVIKGDNVMKQYYNNEEATKSSFTKDGYFLTGDLGVEDEDGFFFITGRKKELIIKGGENISPREIDDTIYKHNSVLEVCTFGIFDEDYGEEISACVFLKDNFKANEKELKDLCIADLGEYKTPSQIIFVDEPLPKGPSGKIQRLKIAEQFKQA